MRFRGISCRMTMWFAVVGLALSTPARVLAQSTNASTSGIAVDAKGVLQMKTFADPTGQLTRERAAAARASLDPKIMAYSKMRKVSLNRLEAAIRDREGAVANEMRNLAGLLRVQYLFYYPETKDIVLAGPAEGWMYDATDRVVGVTTGRPIVQLQDLVVALRAFPPHGKPTPLIGCSIDPTPEGLASMQQFLRRVGSNINPVDTAMIVQGLQTSLGMHTVSINGVSPRSHFAQVMVEADYRMKLIGIGLEQPPVKLVSYVERANPAQVAANALERWFFTPDYQCVRISEDGLAMQLVGDGVKLVGEAEVVVNDGQRKTAVKPNAASQGFVANFTKVYPELADRSPVYAELRNLIDLSIMAAFMQTHDFYGKAGWSMPFFGDEKSYALETYNAPRQTSSAINAIWKSGRLMTPIGGGIAIDASQALSSENQLSDEKGAVSKTRGQIKVDLAKDQWWWD
jgi:hypothetical protein